ncbi:carbonic anhydrase [Streptomyces sp. NBC_01506]|uniref:carbonic anhydrase n=1 Tax=Streptomyces sp. NBC_01506 TaxID=2903887 RepID=UPI00386D0A0F
MVAGGLVAGTGLTLGGAAPAVAAPRTVPMWEQYPPGTKPATPQAAEQLLFDVNHRWLVEGQVHPREDSVARNQAATLSQHPWAMIVGCIDSRVPPELIFDQGLGDLFVVRTAGQVLDEAVYGSTTYAAKQSSVKLIVVLGHEKCGAVNEAISVLDTPPGPDYSPRLKFLTEAIKPAIPPVGTPDRTNLTVNQNVRLIRNKLMAETAIADRIAAGTLNVIGARYELSTWIATKVT